MIKINTKDFGVLDICEEEVIHVPAGLYAFEEFTEFVLLAQDGCLQKWLQAVKAENPRFIVFDPQDIVAGYHPVLSPEVLAELKIDPNDDPAVYVIATIPAHIKNMTVNLKSPLAVNPKRRLAAQIILENENYPIRHRVFQENGGIDSSC